jgi:hypothetical protein
MRLLVSALVAISAAVTTHAQTILLPQPDARLPEFAVATIKPASATYIGIYLKPGGRVAGGNCSVQYLVEIISDATFEGIKKLGLELKSGKAPVDSIVVDAVAQPPRISLLI